ncbi:MAG: C40 family peptidase [Chitinophagaceae bacterium]|nr:C40 family peptidase [Chitinophagaceae bacterium]
MRLTIHMCWTACLAIFLVISASCNSSQELLSPQSYRYAKKQGNVRFIEDISISPSASRQIKVIAGDKLKPQPVVSDELLSKYATMIGLVPKAMSNYILYKFIDDWYGVKYSYGGTDKSGIDCSAFVQKLYEEVFCTELVRTSRDQFHSCKMVWDIDNLIEGDLVFFRTRGKRISHVGIYLANNFFVHASSSGVMISNITESYWSKRFAGAGKIPKGDKEKQLL